jgi:aminoglycoside phosphotransferase (APT) family kinase protein
LALAGGRSRVIGERVSGLLLDLAKLDAFLRPRVDGAAGEMRVERVSGGQSNPTFFVAYDDRQLVLRMQPAGTLLPSAHAVDREYRIIRALAGSAVPVPDALLFCEDRGVIGTMFYIMERLEGRVFHDAGLRGADPAERGQMYRAFATTLAALHNVNPAAIGLADYGRPNGYFARQIARWGRQWELSRTREDPTVERLREWLAANVPDDDPASIVHGDFRIGNVMFHPTEPRVIGVLDWELSTLGHPLADLAHSCIVWHSRPDEHGGLAGLDLPALGIPDRAAFEADYYVSAGHGLRITGFHMAFALFRFAVIFEGIAARARAGNAAATDAAEVGRLSTVMAARAAEIVWP